MATRSNIAIENEDGKIVSIYCHWNGCPEGVGQTLKDHYKELAKVQELIDLGDISSLGENVSPVDENSHSFYNPTEGVTVAYHRDRGEEYNRRISNSRGEYIADSEEYSYLFSNNRWLIYDGSGLDFSEY